MRAAVILAGGRGSRFGFRDKSLIQLNGKPLLAHVIDTLYDLVEEILISLRSYKQAKKLDKIIEGKNIRIVVDEVVGYGPIAGINAAMKALTSEVVFLTGCDMPNLKTDVIKQLFMLIEDYDAVVPIWENGDIESLHSVYRRDSTLTATDLCISNGEKKLFEFINRLDVRYVRIDEIKRLDPSLLTFSNINSPEDIIVAAGHHAKL